MKIFTVTNYQVRMNILYKYSNDIFRKQIRMRVAFIFTGGQTIASNFRIFYLVKKFLISLDQTVSSFSISFASLSYSCGHDTLTTPYGEKYIRWSV